MVDDEGLAEIWELEFPLVPPSALTRNQRHVIYLRYVMQMKFVEIAAETGRSREAVIRTHTQALHRLEKFLLSSLLAHKLLPPLL
jgi:DNA-directed RNA polymerase specialized sigma subunit